MKAQKTILTSALVSASLASSGASAKTNAESWPQELADMATIFDSSLVTLKALENGAGETEVSFGDLFHQQHGVNVGANEPLLVRTDEEASMLQIGTLDGLYIEVAFSASSTPLNKI